MSERVLDDKYIAAIQAIWNTGLFTQKEIGDLFFVSRTTVMRYLDVKVGDKDG